jgi:hypothetical protein
VLSPLATGVASGVAFALAVLAGGVVLGVPEPEHAANGSIIAKTSDSVKRVLSTFFIFQFLHFINLLI